MQNLIICSIRACVIFLFFSSANSQSQISIMGKVISEENRRGLQGVDVYIEKFNIGVTSSEAGDFFIKRRSSKEGLFKVLNDWL